MRKSRTFLAGLCHYFLIWTSQYFMTAQQFDKLVDTDVEVNLAVNERNISVEYLDSSGIVSTTIIYS